MKSFKGKIAFVEPYVSTGAHSYKHITLIPEILSKKGVDCIFYVDKSARVPENSLTVKKVFVNPNDIEGLEEEKVIKIRSDEYKKFLISEKSKRIVFLTVKDADFVALVEALTSPELFEKIKNGNRIIFIHSAYYIYPSLLLVSKSKREMISQLRGKVRFTFYSEFQVDLMRKIMPEFDSDFLPLPVYDKIYEVSKRKRSSKKSYLSYFGLYNILKRPYLIYNCVDKINENYLIHLFPAGERNVFFLLNFLKKKKGYPKELKLIFNRVDKDVYINHLLQSKIGLLPYDDEKYGFQASGIFEEYVLAGIPVVVPQDTWMSAMIDKFKAGGVAFMDETDFHIKVKLILDGYDEFKKRALEAREKFFEFRKSDIFLEAVFEGKTVYSEDWSEDFRDVFNNGYYYIREIFFEKMNKNYGIGMKRVHFYEKGGPKTPWRKKLRNYRKKKKKVRHIALDIESDRLFVYGFMYPDDILRTKDVNFIEKLVDLGILNYEEMDLKDKEVKSKYIDLLRSLKKDIITNGKDITFYAGKASDYFGEVNLAVYYYSNFIEGLQIEDEIVENKFVYACERLYKLTGEKLFLDKIISHIQSKNEKSPKEYYWIAAALEKMDQYNDAVDNFNRAAIYDGSGLIKANAYYHIGNIMLKKGDLKSAEKYLKKCVDESGNFEIAKKILKEIKSK